jgi:hypothetical protein
MTLLKNDPMALVSSFDQDPILSAAHEKFVQEGIDRWHKKRTEKKEEEERSQEKGERRDKT